MNSMQEHLKQIQRLTDYRASQKAASPEPETPKPIAPDPTIKALEQSAQAFFQLSKLYKNSGN